MSEDRPTKGSSNPSWFERLTKALLGEPKDREQLLQLMRDAQKRQLLDSDALSMIEGVLQVSDMHARDIMIPRGQIVCVNKEETINEYLPRIIESAHSRFPVFSDDKSEIIGILLAKDLLALCAKNAGNNIDLKELIRPPVFIPESKRLDVLLRDFKSSRVHMAIVIDEYGAASGLVTIEDVLEQIVGDIEDEHDIDDESLILKHSNNEYMIKALTPIEDFNEYFNAELKDDEFDTIGGTVMNQLGHLPKRGETTHVNHYQFEVLRADNRRIHLLKMRIKENADTTVTN